MWVGFERMHGRVNVVVQKCRTQSLVSVTIRCYTPLLSLDSEVSLVRDSMKMICGVFHDSP